MRRIIESVLMALVVAGFLGSASVVLAAPKLECSVTKDGKATTRYVEKAADCTRMGGKLIDAKPKAKSKAREGMD